VRRGAILALAVSYGGLGGGAFFSKRRCLSILRQGFREGLSLFVGLARFLKVDPIPATMAAKHVNQVSTGQQ
jgi:hypothetical protein